MNAAPVGMFVEGYKYPVGYEVLKISNKDFPAALEEHKAFLMSFPNSELHYVFNNEKKILTYTL